MYKHIKRLFATAQEKRRDKTPVKITLKASGAVILDQNTENPYEPAPQKPPITIKLNTPHTGVKITQTDHNTDEDSPALSLDA